MRLAIIPARGGSKRIPRKNIKMFLGKPIIAYSIEAALESGIFDRVIVSTDDAEIADVARKYGAEVPFLRPEELSTDTTGTLDVVKHAINWVSENDVLPDLVCCIYATAPMIRIQDLVKGHELLVSKNKKYSFSVTSFPFPIQRAFRLTAEGEVEMFWPEHYQTRSQDLEEAYHDAGQFYWGTSEAFLSDVPVFSLDAVPVTLPRHLVQDIDTHEDWVRAEHMFRALALDGL